MQSFHDSLHVGSMSITGQLYRQVAVQSHDRLQEVNPKFYQFECGLCVENFVPHCSTLIYELKCVCHLTLVKIDTYLRI